MTMLMVMILFFTLLGKRHRPLCTSECKLVTQSRLGQKRRRSSHKGNSPGDDSSLSVELRDALSEDVWRNVLIVLKNREAD